LQHDSAERFRARFPLNDADRRRRFGLSRSDYATKGRPSRETAGVHARIRESERLDELTARFSVQGRPKV
jgi:hypothetical protein